jgi:hypothetical protein
VKPPPRNEASPSYNIEGLVLAAASPQSRLAAAGPESSCEDLPANSPVVHLLAQEDADALPRFRWETKLTAGLSAGTNARLRARPRLTVARWPGNVEVASRITAKLVDNAAQWGLPFPDGSVGLRMTVGPVTEELVIEVDDALPHFDRFEAVTSDPVAGCTGNSLRWASGHGARLSWELRRGDDDEPFGKTVRAIVPVSKAEERA